MNIALITASGKGTRMQNETPKQFLEVNGYPLLYYTIKAFEDNPKINQIYVVTNPEYVDFVMSWKNKYSLTKLVCAIPGGKVRQESVYLGLKSLKVRQDDLILIHDGARPLISQKIIDENIDAGQIHSAVETVVKCFDTVAVSKNGLTNEGSLNRDEIYLVQTPQTFKYSVIMEAHEKFKNVAATDDATLAKMNGNDIYFVEGNKNNIKVTTPEDLTYLKNTL